MVASYCAQGGGGVQDPFLKNMDEPSLFVNKLEKFLTSPQGDWGGCVIPNGNLFFTIIIIF